MPSEEGYPAVLDRDGRAQHVARDRPRHLYPAVVRALRIAVLIRPRSQAPPAPTHSRVPRRPWVGTPDGSAANPRSLAERRSPAQSYRMIRGPSERALEDGERASLRGARRRSIRRAMTKLPAWPFLVLLMTVLGA